MSESKGILLVNLGTPNSPKPKDVYRYLIEFLLDERVMDLPWLWRQILVRGVIVPFRYKQSAKSYQAIWTEEGSPLMVHTKKIKNALQAILNDTFHIEIGMRYQNPSIREGIDKLIKKEIDHLLILPLFPHYASATTGSVYEETMNVLKSRLHIPKVTFLNEYSSHPSLIAAFCAVSRPYSLDHYDHILFSFHGLPQRHIKKLDHKGVCLTKKDCCVEVCTKNKTCYRSQCFSTAHAIAQNLKLPPNKYTISFQSRLGKEPWLEPYTNVTIKTLAEQGKKRVLVFCPSFICDCLETTFEIGVENAEEFKHAGGEQLDLVPGLNDHPQWIEALKAIILENTAD